jgi:hypothetical protein
MAVRVSIGANGKKRKNDRSRLEMVLDLASYYYTFCSGCAVLFQEIMNFKLRRHPIKETANST